MGFNLDVARWNYVRNGLDKSPILEQNMFEEEYLEWDTAFKQYLEGSLFVEDVVVDMVDAVCDAIFVNAGSQAKGIFENSNTEKISYMMSTTVEILLELKVNPANVIEQSLMYVVEANNKKPLCKATGKVKKGDDWVDPKEKIRDLLFPKTVCEEALDEFISTAQDI